MRKNVLIGTTNPSKVKRFQDILKDYEVCFLTLKDLNITEEPKESGNSPMENAQIKAGFYGRYFDYVICNDSGLYIEQLSMNDKRQPGLHVRTPKGIRLNDEEMIQYYTELVKTLGDPVLCYYLDGIAVYHQGKISGFMKEREEAKKEAFYMVSKPHKLRHIGWPLDSISVDRNSGIYFVEEEKEETDSVIEEEYRKKLIEFLSTSLELEKSFR